MCCQKNSWWPRNTTKELHYVSNSKSHAVNLRVPRFPVSLCLSADRERSSGQTLRFSAAALENKNKQRILNPPKTLGFLCDCIYCKCLLGTLSCHESKDTQESIHICNDCPRSVMIHSHVLKRIWKEHTLSKAPLITKCNCFQHNFGEYVLLNAWNTRDWGST